MKNMRKVSLPKTKRPIISSRIESGDSNLLITDLTLSTKYAKIPDVRKFLE